MIYIYSGKTAYDADTGNALPDSIYCFVTEQRNGCFDLEMQYPLNGSNSADIAVGAYIKAPPRPDGTVEPFVIYEIDTTIEGVLTVKAHHIVYLLDGISGTVSTTGITAAVSRLNTLAGSDYLFANDGIVDTTTALTSNGLVSVWSVVGTVISAFGCEVEYHYNGSTHKTEITFHSARGTAKSTTIQYGSNIIELDRLQTSASVYSSVRAWWWDGTNLSSVVSATVSTGVSTVSRELLLDCKQVFPSSPTTAELQAVAQAYIDANYLTESLHDELSVNFVPLDITTEGATSERLDICDTATVDASLIGVSAQAECIEVVYNVLTEKYDSVKVGIMQKTIVDTIADISSSPSAVSASWRPSTGATTQTMPGSSSLANNSWVGKANLTLSPGVYVLEGGCRFAANATGYRAVVLASSNNSSTILTRGARTITPAVDGVAVAASFTMIREFTEQTTLYVNAYQNSGSALTVYPWFRAVRIQ